VKCALAECNEQFIPISRQRLKYCCKDHQRIGTKREMAANRHAAAAHKWKPKKCKWAPCGKVFDPKGTPWNDYCCREHRLKAAHERAEIPTARRLAKKHGLTLIEGGKADQSTLVSGKQPVPNVGRPRKERIGNRVVELRRDGKSWAQTTLTINREFRVSLAISTIRSYAENYG